MKVSRCIHVDVPVDVDVPLNRIHKALLGAVEKDDSEEHGDAQKGSAIEKPPDGECANAKTTVFECLKDGREGIDIEVCLILSGGEAHRVDDRGRIHQQLNAKTDEHVEVTVLSCE